MRLGMVLVVLTTGCGRIGFDPAGATGDGPADDGLGRDGPLGDGPPAVSCGTLASTCGPTGSSPCCESPVLPGGLFSRSYDLALGTPYTFAGYQATLSTFRIDTYEVTVGRFRTFVDAGMGT